MKYPRLVLPLACKTEATIILDQEGLTPYGEPLTPYRATCLCNYQSSAKTIWTRERKSIQLSGVLYIDGDIAPELPEITSGTVTICGETRQIAEGRKHRNPDGTVNFTELSIV